MDTKLFLRFFVLFLCIFSFGLFFANRALAANYILSGQVTDNSNNPIAGATVTVSDSNNDSTTTDSFGDYSLSIPQGAYNVQVTPPSGNGFTSAIALSQNISANTILNFFLVPTGTVTLTGHVYDPFGNPLSNQTVSIFSADGSLITRTTTDSNGNYSLQTTPGTYELDIAANNPFTVNAPPAYDLNVSSYQLTQSTILNITLPAKKVTMHVQDSSNNPVGNVTLTTSRGASIGNVSIGGGITNANSFSDYGTNNSGSSVAGPTTDSSGNVTLWLLPSDSNNPFTFTATPPSGSNFITTNLSNTIITTDANLTMTMQQPVTLSGYVYSPLGNTVPNQKVSLELSDGTLVAHAITDSSGSYSIQAAPGNYYFEISGDNNSSSLNVPQQYDLNTTQAGSAYSLTQNTTLSFTIPAKQVSFHLQDIATNPVSGVDVSADVENNQYANTGGLSFGNGITNASGTDTYGGNNGHGGDLPVTTDSSGNVTLWLLPNDTTSYDFTFNPPSGSSYSTATLSKISITSNTSETVTMQQPVTLSGHVYDPLGNPLANQTVSLFTSDGSLVTRTTTDSTGSYSLETSSGIYELDIAANNPLTVDAPQAYDINVPSYTLNGDTTLDITIPAKKVTVHVQDAANNPVGNVTLTTSRGASVGNISIGGRITNASSFSDYGTNNSGISVVGPTTDSSGNVTLWLLPSDSNNPFTFTATPSSGSVYNAFNLSNTSITTDQTELISLQYNHATPVTTASLSPSPFSDGMYADPTMVTLSANAAAGYTVANTYYTVDGGAQTTYSTPFTVTGAGSHTITYWSVDNSGVPEAINTKTFTITEAYNLTGTVYNDANQNGFQDTGEQGVTGVTISLNTGQSTTTDSNGNYTFSNLESGTYTETVTVPSGYTATTTNPVSVPLAADTTENFGIVQQQSTPVVAINAGGDTEGNYAADTDYSGGTTYSSSDAVDTSSVSNPAPQAVYQTVRYGNTFSYTIPNLTANGTYTVRLHFNELYWNAAGQRVFNVGINGTQVLSNFDIYQTAGGKNKAITEQFPTTADSNGNITISFSTVTDNAMVNGVEVYSGTLPSPTPTATPTPVSSLAISAGGQGSGRYVADTDYTGGSTYNTNAIIDTSGVTDPAPQSVYQNVRYGNTFSYTIPTYSPNTNYKVRLDFSEPYWSSAGQREFNVSINGTQVLNNFDVYQQAGGENKAISETFNTTSDSKGLIKIQFTTVTDNAMVSGIQVTQQ